MGFKKAIPRSIPNIRLFVTSLTSTLMIMLFSTGDSLHEELSGPILGLIPGGHTGLYYCSIPLGAVLIYHWDPAEKTPERRKWSWLQIWKKEITDNLILFLTLQMRTWRSWRSKRPRSNSKWEICGLWTPAPVFLPHCWLPLWHSTGTCYSYSLGWIIFSPSPCQE